MNSHLQGAQFPVCQGTWIQHLALYPVKIRKDQGRTHVVVFQNTPSASVGVSSTHSCKMKHICHLSNTQHMLPYVTIQFQVNEIVSKIINCGGNFMIKVASHLSGLAGLTSQFLKLVLARMALLMGQSCSIGLFQHVITWWARAIATTCCVADCG